MTVGGGPSDAAVAATFAGYPEPARTALLALRDLILETAAETPGVGPLTEALRWKQPAYLTRATGAGTTIRVDAVKNEPGAYALYVNCKTTLMESYRNLYPDAFRYIGQRELRLRADEAPDSAALKHCIALALTYRRGGKASA
jgi:hypothetical protein